ncbi:MAG TPA: DUF5666 domain-containing protein [Candidatus Acidoferrum sp.]|nr:DUF5666 domain-containing protein [Candidatus Acidoferrum sp.]
MKSGRVLLLTMASVAGVMAVTARKPTAAFGAQAAAARPVGTIKSISGNIIVLTTDNSGDVNVVVQDAAKLVRVEPGQKDLKEAVPIALKDLLPGDRILVRGQLGEDGKTVFATAVIAMKKASIAEKQAHERDAWRQGTAGLVSSVDPAANSIVITQPGIGEKKTVTIHLSKDTVVRRYAPDSIKFDDAKPATVEQVKAGDQLRARGTRTADGSELTAAEIVCGTFRNIAGTISSIDASANTMTLQDLASKKSVTVRITPDSQVRKLPPQMAQGIAMRMKGAAANAQGSASGGASGAATQEAKPGPGGSQAGGSGEGGSGRTGRGGGGDFQQALSRIPTVTLADLQKGDAVMIVATEGGANDVPSVITLLGGVEPILQASPNSSASSILSPWSLGGGDAGGGDAGNP